MSQYPMTETISRREFSYEGPNGAGQIVVEVGKPALFPDAPRGDWYCPFIIEGASEPYEFSIGGVDSLQALLLAISAVNAHLRLLANHTKLNWQGSDDLGISLSEGN
jgi:hypothetical protein